jgi:hypothetical protein
METGASILAEGTPPRTIAERYEVRDRIGGGAFGEVFEVYDLRLRRLVALKTLPIESIANLDATEDLRRFHMEARAVARLSHPGIVTVHDFGETQDFAWIVMELVIGETLKAVLDRDERPSLAEAVRVTCDLLDALHYAHGRGIVHRDVKPANILLAVTAAAGLGEVRLADFGIARMGEAQHTVAGQVIGTPVAMSPEQVRGEEVDLRSDLWSVGVILYQLLTGARPFPGGMPAIFQNILTQDPKAPSLVVSGLPAELDTVIATALAKNPEDRYPDAAAMANAIRAAGAPWPVPEPAGMEAAETIRLTPMAARSMGAGRSRSGAPAGPPRGWTLGIGFAAGALFGVLLTYALLTDDPLGFASSGPPAVIAQAPAQATPPAPLGQEPALPNAEPTPMRSDPGSAPPPPLPAAPESAPDPAAQVPIATPLPASAAGGGDTLWCGRDRLAIRTGSQSDFGRIIFDWSGPIRHEFLPREDGALLRFPDAGCLPSLERLAMPRNVLDIRPDGEGSGLLIETAPGIRLRVRQMDGNRVVVDALDNDE